MHLPPRYMQLAYTRDTLLLLVTKNFLARFLIVKKKCKNYCEYTNQLRYSDDTN
jgi:hypothetical protein